jgi:hypothetical protein
MPFLPSAYQYHASPLPYTSTLEMEAAISLIMLVPIYSEDHNLVRSEATIVMLIKIQVSWDMKTSIWNTMTMQEASPSETWATT